MIFHAVTAGKETDRIVQFAEAVGAPNLHLRISIDGLGDIHEKMRGVPGLHERALATVDRLLPLREKKGFHLGVNVAVNDQTLPHLAAMVDFCAEREITIAPGLAVSPFLEDIDPAEKAPRVLMANQKEAIRETLNQMTKRPQGGYSLGERLRLEDLNHHIWDRMLDGAKATLDGPNCEALRSFIYLLPDGGVSACGLRQASVGNLMNASFEDVWMSAEALKKRQEITNCVGCLQHSATVFSKVYGGGSTL